MTSIPEKIRQNMICTREIMSLVSPRILMERTPQMIRHESDIIHPVYNSIIAYHGAVSEEALVDIRTIAEHYRIRRIPFTWLSWSHDANADDLTKALEENGLSKVDDITGMSLSLIDWSHEAPAIPGFVIKPIRTASEMFYFRDIVPPVFRLDGEAGDVLVQICEAAAFGENPKYRHYVGFLNGEPAAVATAVHEGDTIGIYNVATLDAYRRKGLGSALTVHALREGQAAGGRLAVLLASKLGANVYRAIGFKEETAIEVYLG